MSAQGIKKAPEGAVGELGAVAQRYRVVMRREFPIDDDLGAVASTVEGAVAVDGEGSGLIIDTIGFDCDGRVVSSVALDEIGERDLFANLRHVAETFRSTEAKNEVHGYLTPF